MSRTRTIVMVAAAACLGAAVTALTAGPLDPPVGPIAPTHKTLSEVEPRIAINAINTPGDANSLFRITQPGSYYLTGNITGVAGKSGIEIVASNVVIDLMGYAVQGVAGSATGIAAVGERDGLTIRNGSVTGWGNSGISASFTTSESGRLIESIQASQNGSNGISAGRGTVVRDCVAFENGGSGFNGFDSTVFERCVARANTQVGFGLSVSSSAFNCISRGNGSHGFQASANDAKFESCESVGNALSGFSLSGSGSVIECLAAENTLNGIGGGNLIVRNVCRGNGVGASVGSGIVSTLTGAVITDNTCAGNDSGIRVSGNRSRVDNNHVTDNTIGFEVTGNDNFIVRNSASTNGTNYSIDPGNAVGPRVNVTDSDGFAGVTNANHPWANFGH